MIEKVENIDYIHVERQYLMVNDNGVSVEHIHNTDSEDVWDFV